MRTVVLYKPRSDHGSTVEDFIYSYRQRYGNSKLEVVDVESREGIATATLYDVWQFPAVLVMQDNGYLQKSWEGQNLPVLDEVFAYSQP